MTETEQKMFDWDNELRFYSAEYSDEKVIEVAQKAIDFAYTNFKEQEEVYEGYKYNYEVRISNVALGIEAYLQKSPKNKKSKLILDFILSVINTEKYGGGRSGFIYLFYILKMDLELKKIARERPDFWKQPRIRFQLLYALYRRKIQGFEKEVEMLIQDYPKETPLKKYANKYLEQQRK
ncbi:MAG: hypothetical protein Q4C98_07000 [Capnocytophaga sp.]|nr:hypothetical protein [Capnocytophaga sp.]